MTSSFDDRLRVTVVGIDGANHVLGPEIPEVAGPPTEVRPLPITAHDRAIGRRRYEITVDAWIFEVAVESEARAGLRERATQASSGVGELDAQVITARIPGRVVRCWVAEGDTVEVGQRLLAVEAMKMENEVRATRAGVVEAIKVVVGSSVELGDELLTVR